MTFRVCWHGRLERVRVHLIYGSLWMMPSYVQFDKTGGHVQFIFLHCRRCFSDWYTHWVPLCPSDQMTGLERNADLQRISFHLSFCYSSTRPGTFSPRGCWRLGVLGEVINSTVADEWTLHVSQDRSSMHTLNRLGQNHLDSVPGRSNFFSAWHFMIDDIN